MSLINDALKQTKQVRPESPPVNPPPLSPVESAAPEGLGWLLPGLVVLLLVAAGVIVGLSLFKPVPLAASAAPVPRPRPAVVAPATQHVQSVAVTLPAPTNAPPASNTVVVLPPKPPEPKLEGILFAASRPCAIVNGRTVFVGDFVGKFRVAAILKDSVTLHDKTETKVLSLKPR